MNDQPVRLLLVDLPPGTSAQHIGFARPLGERAAVIARLVELLPGTTFKTVGRGSFKRATYEIAFTIVEPEPHSIEVEIDHHEGFVALKRLVAKTGWQMIDPVGETFVDIDASAAVGAIVPLMTSAADPAQSTTDEGPGLRRWVGLATLVACVLGSIWFGWKGNHRTPTIQELLASRPVAEPGSGTAPSVASGRVPAMPGAPTEAGLERARQDFLRAADQQRWRMTRMKLIAADFRFDPIVHQLYDYRHSASVFPSMLGGDGYVPPERFTDTALFRKLNIPVDLPPGFRQEQRDGYAFEFLGRYAAPEQLADATLLRRLGTQPMLEAYFAQPVRQGYEFEFIGEKPDYLRGPLRVFGKVYESFVYVAWPVEPGPEGRRTLALYPDGQVFATSEPRRVPTREDEVPGAR